MHYKRIVFRQWQYRLLAIEILVLDSWVKSHGNYAIIANTRHTHTVPFRTNVILTRTFSTSYKGRLFPYEIVKLKLFPLAVP